MPDCFIVTRDDKFLGVGDTRSLLECITQQQIHAARYANPLTGLPGNVPILETVEGLLARKEPFAIAYFDLNQFKPYNDLFGYSQGDRVIQLVGDVLLEHADHERDFVGHIGGDDFVMLFRSTDWLARCQAVVGKFDAAIRRFYNTEALAAGGVWSEDRSGKPWFFGLLSMACGVAVPDAASCQSHHEVAALATQAKREAKKRSGSYVHAAQVERRLRDVAPLSQEVPAT
jgi:GGDEF domain-containing protein